MTLKPYSAKMLDQFALQLLDLAALAREMAQKSRQHEITDFAAHDKKANEWYRNLERWMLKSQAELEMRIIDARAERRALESAE